MPNQIQNPNAKKILNTIQNTKYKIQNTKPLSLRASREASEAISYAIRNTEYQLS